MPAQAVPLVFEGPTWIDGSIDGSILPALSENWVQYGTAWYSTSKSSIKLIFDHHFPSRKICHPILEQTHRRGPQSPQGPVFSQSSRSISKRRCSRAACHVMAPYGTHLSQNSGWLTIALLTLCSIQSCISSGPTSPIVGLLTREIRSFRP